MTKTVRMMYKVKVNRLRVKTGRGRLCLSVWILWQLLVTTCFTVIFKICEGTGFHTCSQNRRVIIIQKEPFCFHTLLALKLVLYYNSLALIKTGPPKLAFSIVFSIWIGYYMLLIISLAFCFCCLERNISSFPRHEID